ncbi:MAG: hypothetical protein COY39_01195 [Alphaproteobacteria bacterium CG_4_10_14_0_8_um_filter_37_21]|nr:MAG: hypothetical protein COY39_01195 [Alphaproteobacteria bacterium CG_4_10_14_0_8_um_filter_37_21]
MVDSINTNTAAIAARNALAKNNKELAKQQQNLATGSLISDPSNLPGPAGVAFALSADIKTTQAAAKNIVQGEAFVQTGAGALASLQEMFEQMSSLAATANNDMTLDATAKTYLDAEYQALKTQVGNVIADTNFNGVKFFDGSAGTLDMQVGTAATEIITYDGGTALAPTATGDISDATNAATEVAALKADRATVSAKIAEMGALKSRMGFISNNVGTTIQNLSGAKAAFADTDIPAALERSQTLGALVDVAGAMMNKSLEKAGKLSELVKSAR